jgi:poly(A) polymerase
METFSMKPCNEVGLIKTRIKDAILDGTIDNNPEDALQYMLEIGKELGLIN